MTGDETIVSNTGVIVEAPRPEDWVSGQETGLAFAEAEPSGDWTPYLPSDERQSGRFGDTMACVTFSALNVIETQLNRLLATGGIPDTTLLWLQDNGYFDAAGKINFADRPIAKLSGTTREGNSLVRVADAIRTFGLVAESDWKYDRDTFDWDTYYADVPQWIIDKGKEFLKRFSIAYEWAHTSSDLISKDDLLSHLKQTPVQIAAAVCPPWTTTDIIKACGLPVAHATMIYSVDPLCRSDFDHYVPFRKRLAHDYPIPWILKIVIRTRAAAPEPPPVAPEPWHHKFEVNISYGSRGLEVVALQTALKLAGHFPANVNATGYYGTITANAVLAYQRAKNVDSPALLKQLAGKIVGPKTRDALNRQFAA